jgi:integrase/recombinase XerD
MAEDMQLRNLAPATIDAYTYHVDKFCRYFDKPADQLGLEEIRQFQLYLVHERKHIPFGKRPKKLPVVLSDEEAARLFQCLHNPKHRAVLLTCYAAGLRLREATHLRVADIDGKRQQIHIHQSKGSQDRMVPASPRLLAELREYWKIQRPGNDLFPGKTPDTPLSSATVQKACKLLGHSRFVTTMIYLHVRRQHFDRSPSPIDWLPVRQCPKWAEASLSQSILPHESPATTQSPGTSEDTPETTGDTPTEEPPSPVRRTSGRKPRTRRRR